MRGLLLSWLTLWLFAAPAAATPTSVLATEPKLSGEVTLRLRRVPLCDFAAELSRQTGVPIATSEDTADERVTLFVRQRPAREVLARVAEHFDYSWVAEDRQGKRTLVLIQDLASKRRERALRGGPERDVAELRNWLEGEVQKANSPEVASLRKQPLEDRQQRWAELDEALNGAWVRREDGSTDRAPTKLPPAEREELLREQKRLFLAAPELFEFNFGTISSVAYGALPAEQREALWAGEPVTLAFPPERSRFSLSAEQAVQIAAGGLRRQASRDDPATGRPIYQAFGEVKRLRVRLALEPHGTQTLLNVRLRTVGSGGFDGQFRLSECTFKEDILPEYFRDQMTDEALLDPTCEALKAEVTLPVTVLPPSPRHPSGTETRCEEVLEQLADRTSYSILADAYQTGALEGPLASGATPLNVVLRNLCRYFTRKCRLQNGYLLLRHRYWARARAKEPPARAVRRWDDHRRRYGYLRFTDTIEIGGRLTAEQAETYQTYVEWEAQGQGSPLEGDLHQSGPVLRFLYSLPITTRRALEAGSTVQMRSLPQRCLRYAPPIFLEAADPISGHEDFDYPEGPFIAGTGFAREDELEGRWTEARVTLTRKPQRWVFSDFNCELIEDDAQLKDVLDNLRELDPKYKPQVIDGELIEVAFTIPGAAPVRHWFLNPTHELLPHSGQ